MEEKSVGSSGKKNICTQCGAVFVGHFCPDCGAKAEEEIAFCPVCGADRTSGKKFCANCGFSFVGATAPAKTDEESQVAITIPVSAPVVESGREEKPKAKTPVTPPKPAKTEPKKVPTPAQKSAPAPIKWKYNRQGEYIYFGEYPQTIKADDVTITTTQDSRGYFLGSDGAYYAKVTATPWNSGYTFSNNSSVTKNRTYYFRVEPIRWRVLSESDGTALIVCDSIIANKAFDKSSNNYAKSDIRAWLNGEFYNTAFNDLQKELFLLSIVDNSIKSTGYRKNEYACENTTDRIFLLSYQEANSKQYGFSETEDKAKQKSVSDYARATGAYMNTGSSYYGNGWWWLRSPNDFDSYYARSVAYDGRIDHYGSVKSTSVGVVPALQIRL